MSAASEASFESEVAACFSRLVAAFDAFDPDEVEAERAGDVIRISFSEGRNCIVNRQSAAKQIWMAEGATAWHFSLDAAGEWLDTKGRGTLYAVLSEVLSRRLGRRISL